LKRLMLRERYAAWYADTIKYRDHWPVSSGKAGAGGMAGAGRALRERAVDWVYAKPERLALVNRLRGRR
jgi:hypothetical protein